ncbi:MAG: hypothetical protein M1821_006956 [Bathelium mastoideum]|nr:MAG: hypothetical protein M1821_006956 [Bathelium mastoideum]
MSSSLLPGRLHRPSASWPLSLLFLTLLLLEFASCELNNWTSPVFTFQTRPEIHAPIVGFDVLRPELVTPGFIFTAPYRNVDSGVYIYDNYGNLIWASAADHGPTTAHAPHVCSYKGKPHLCYFRGHQHQGYSRGHGVIMDETYRIVKTVESAGHGAVSDMHEFRLVGDGTTALMTVYQPRQYDLSDFKINGGMGWVVDSVFQEVDVETGKLLFEWRSLDHIDPQYSYTMPATTDTSGDGLQPWSPWDYFHINSIDKNKDGDYLVSGRHVAAIYKISGQNGTILWELNGAKPTFKMANFRFSSQHHARWHFENGTHTYLTLFDNASNGVNRTNDWSHGLIVLIDHTEMTATMIAEYGAPDPEGGVSAGSQGSMQLLPNNNVFMGWGEKAYFSEHMSNGLPVMYGKMARPESWVMIYRCYKFNWTGLPITSPTLWTYSRTGQDLDGMMFYVSWNGATEVRTWNFFTSDSPKGPWTPVANTAWTSFETRAHYNAFRPWSLAQGLDENGRVLGVSAVVKTFVPSPGLASFCSDQGCGVASLPPDDEKITQGGVEFRPHGANYSTGYDTANYFPALDSSSTGDNDSPGHESVSLVRVGSVTMLIGFAALMVGLIGCCFYRRRAMQIANGWSDTVQQFLAGWEEAYLGSRVRQAFLGKYALVPQSAGA